MLFFFGLPFIKQLEEERDYLPSNLKFFLSRSIYCAKGTQNEFSSISKGPSYRRNFHVHLYNKHKFLKERVEKYSEADFIIKFWSYIFKSFFEETALTTFWVYTITDVYKEEDLKKKLDFRIGIFSPSFSFTYDTGTGEFAKPFTPHLTRC
ncbi:hypothetical protein EDC94DRAFT_580065 [Helicostylum pulchrum]|nr:hypothetical protein EDC94DRAFT_580065 [Helicostylum pulchrum]